jgi:hypothetical protein
VCAPVTSTNQFNQDKSSATFKLVVASVSNNNASSFDNKPSSTFRWLLHLLIGNQKPFQTNHSEPYVLTESKQNAIHLSIDCWIQAIASEDTATIFG